MDRGSSVSHDDPLHLTIVSAGPRTMFFLSDLRSLALAEDAAVDENLLRDVQSAASRVIASSRDDSEALRADLVFVSEALHQRMLPRRIAAALSQGPVRELHLLAPQDWAALPWELAFDREQFLGTRFRLTRHLVRETAAPAAARWNAPDEVCKVLAVAGAALPEAATLRFAALGAEIRQAGDFIVESLHGTAALQERSRALVGQGVVHVIANAGDPDASRLRQALMECRPRLVIAELVATESEYQEAQREWLRESAGLNLVLRICPRRDCTDRGFTTALYRALAAGHGADEATRLARRREGVPRPVADIAAIYSGEADVAVLPPGTQEAAEDARQVTALCYDLANSTALVNSMRPEDYAALISHYHGVCAGIVGRHGGLSGKPQGSDGVMCYFNVPQADENASAQCLRAALGIAAAVRGLGLGVRIGVASGRAAIRAGQPWGPDLHLAERLQKCALPGEVMVAESTVRLTDRRFEFHAAGIRDDLKGFEGRKVLLHKLLRERPSPVETGVQADGGISPFVGRDEELDRLKEQWQLVCRGGARASIVSGEAGMGKSRLVREFIRLLETEGSTSFECQCSPHHTGSAFHPVIGWLRQWLGIDEFADAGDALHRIRSRTAGMHDEGIVRAVAGLLAVKDEAQAQASPEKLRQATLEALVRLLQAHAAEAPLCFVVEDVQWMDPSTRLFLEMLAARASGQRLFVLMTLRTEGEAHWQGPFLAREIHLHGLAPEAARTIVAQASAGADLPPEVIRTLAERGDGVPLFLEESARMWAELSRDGRRPGNDWQAASRPVPETLQDLLMARLDRLGAAKQVAQIGAAIGREFPHALLAAVVEREPGFQGTQVLAQCIDTLVASGLLLRHDRPDRRAYLFKHALVRDAAYHSMWERERERLHRGIAAVFENDFEALGDSQPEVLAHHYTLARLPAQALAQWEKAARQAAARSAHREAIGHLERALALCASRAASAERDRIELKLQALLAAQLMATEGYGAEGVERAYARAADLARALGDGEALMRVQLGLESYHFMRGDFDKAVSIAADVSSRLDGESAPMRRIQADWALAHVRFHQGAVADAVALMDECLARSAAVHRPGPALQDPRVMCLCYSAWGKWELGEPDEALVRAEAVVTLAEELDHGFSLAEAWGFKTTVHYFRGEHDSALECARRAMAECEKGGYAVWLAHAEVMHGRLLAEAGDSEAGIAQMRSAHCAWASTGAVVTQAFYLAMQAEGLLIAQRPDEAMAVVDMALQIVRRVGEGYYEPELIRLAGAARQQQAVARGEDASGEVQRRFRAALELARFRRLHSLALRAAADLAQMQLQEGRHDEAQALLAEALGNVHGGRSTRDVLRVLQMMDAAGSGGVYRSHAIAARACDQ